jgi:hypothetical protein
MSDNDWHYEWKIQHNTFDTTTSGMFGKKMSEHEKQMYRIKNYKNQTLVKPDGSKQVVLTPAPAIQPTFRPLGTKCTDYEYKLIPTNVNLDDTEVNEWLKLFIKNNDKDVYIFKKYNVRDKQFTYYKIALGNQSSKTMNNYPEITMNTYGCEKLEDSECREDDINNCKSTGGKTRKQRKTKSRKQKKSKSRRQRK